MRKILSTITVVGLMGSGVVTAKAPWEPKHNVNQTFVGITK